PAATSTWLPSPPCSSGTHSAVSPSSASAVHRCRHSGSGAGSVSVSAVPRTPAIALRSWRMASPVGVLGAVGLSGGSGQRGAPTPTQQASGTFLISASVSIVCVDDRPTVKPPRGASDVRDDDLRLRQPLLRDRGRLHPPPGQGVPEPGCAVGGCRRPSSPAGG